MHKNLCLYKLGLEWYKRGIGDDINNKVVEIEIKIKDWDIQYF